MSAAADALERFLRESEIPFARAGDERWVAQLRGERKLTIPLAMWVTGGALHLESFFMRRPQENAEHLYEILLRRNLRAYVVRFALDATGDVYLVGQMPVGAVTEEELDRVVGALLVEADGLFDAAISVGFATYLAHDMAWRRGAGAGA